MTMKLSLLLQEVPFFYCSVEQDVPELLPSESRKLPFRTLDDLFENYEVCCSDFS